MIFQVVAVYDVKARAFAPPFVVSHLDLALRALKDVANNPEHQVGRYPEDFTLYHLGSFDDENANFTLLEQKRNLATAVQFVSSVQPRANLGAINDVQN